jgi:quercetin dioxygenase-like cupin family protein
MKSICLFNSAQFQSTRARRLRKILPLLAVGIAAVALATPPVGFLVNQIVAMGSTVDNIDQQVQMASTPDGSDERWQLQLQAQGASDFYVQQLVLAPGGYSGWHTHPGLLIGTVVSGAIDFFDANCQKRSFTAGQVFMENSQVHGIINTGPVNTELSIAYLVKHNAPRRIEADAPACASATGIP